MSPGRVPGPVHPGSFPRVSGDEPTVTVGKQVKEGFSPRERG